ncbi:MAG: hypothetical protein Q9187_009739, partial [Circinaria calcarea]
AQDAVSLTNSAAAEKHPTLLPAESSYGPAVINKVQDLRTKFSTLEIRAVEIALGPFSAGGTPEMNAQLLESVLGNIASRRDKGEDASLIVTRVKNGGGSATVMSRSELAAALDSDDPASMGSHQGADGKIIYWRDVIKQLAGLLDKMDNSDPKISVARGIIKNLRSADKDTPFEESKSLKLKADKSMLAPEFQDTEYSIYIVNFKADPERLEAKDSYTLL